MVATTGIESFVIAWIRPNGTRNDLLISTLNLSVSSEPSPPFLFNQEPGLSAALTALACSPTVPQHCIIVMLLGQTLTTVKVLSSVDGGRSWCLTTPQTFAMPIIPS